VLDDLIVSRRFVTGCGRTRADTREHTQMRIFWYIECLYNTRRRGSALRHIPPQGYQQRYYDQANAA